MSILKWLFNSSLFLIFYVNLKFPNILYNHMLVVSSAYPLSPFLAAMKSDRKRLKAEKADLVNQMQQLYATLESREEQLRDFIRNYEQHRKVWHPCWHNKLCSVGFVKCCEWINRLKIKNNDDIISLCHSSLHTTVYTCKYFAYWDIYQDIFVLVLRQDISMLFFCAKQNNSFWEIIITLTDFKCGSLPLFASYTWFVNQSIRISVCTRRARMRWRY